MKPKCADALSSFDFNFNLRLYIMKLLRRRLVADPADLEAKDALRFFLAVEYLVLDPRETLRLAMGFDTPGTMLAGDAVQRFVWGRREYTRQVGLLPVTTQFGWDGINEIGSLSRDVRAQCADGVRHGQLQIGTHWSSYFRVGFTSAGYTNSICLANLLACLKFNLLLANPQHYIKYPGMKLLRVPMGGDPYN